MAGYIDLKEHKKFFRSIYQADSYSLKSKADNKFFAGAKEFSLGFCIGWQRLIPVSVLERFSVGVFGMHGSVRNLPFGKGRSRL